jgi:hypothetical protein
VDNLHANRGDEILGAFRLLWASVAVCCSSGQYVDMASRSVEA